MENGELLQAIRQMISENNQKMSEMMDKKLEPIQQDISDLKEGQLKVNITLENNVGKKLSALFDAHQLDSEKIEQIHETVESLNDAYAGTDVLTRVNTAEIKKLKTKIG